VGTAARLGVEFARDDEFAALRLSLGCGAPELRRGRSQRLLCVQDKRMSQRTIWFPAENYAVNGLQACRKKEPALSVQTLPTKSEGNSVQSLAFVGWLPLATVPALVVLRGLQRPWVFMCVLALSIFMALKWLTWWRARATVVHSSWRSVAYLFAWPGMDARTFLDETKRPAVPRFRQWIWAFFEFALGAILVWVVARALPAQRELLRGWTGMVGFVLLLHFGLFQIAALFWQSRGVIAVPIMEAPLRAKSLSEFWGRRWNLGFRQLAHDLVFCPVRKCVPAASASFLVFILSGLIHDLVISVPAHGGYGLPTAYFVLQGLGVMVERSRFGRLAGLSQGVRGWLYVVLITAAPLAWLFHPPFVTRVILPLMQAVGAI
jgi:hypothetical protein